MRFLKNLLVLAGFSVLTVLAINLLSYFLSFDWSIYVVGGVVVLIVFFLLGGYPATRQARESFDEYQDIGKRYNTEYDRGYSEKYKTPRYPPAEYKRMHKPAQYGGPGCSLVFWFLVVPAVIVGIIVLIKNLSGREVWQFMLRNNFLITFIIVFACLQSLLRKRTVLGTSWKKMSDIWLKVNGYSGLSIGGFAFVFTNEDLNKKLLKITTDSNVVDIGMLTSIYIISVLLLGIALLLTAVGRTKSDSEETNLPLAWFLPSFLLAWISSLGLYSLFFNAILMTLNAHLAVR